MNLRCLERSLPKAAYVGAEFFERERHAIFFDQWICAGRSETLNGPLSYRVVDVAGESTLVIRDRSGELHAHLNFCRHRGSRLLDGEGTVSGVIRCPYHGWAYAPDGALLGAPFVPIDEVPEESRRLHHVAVAEWGGFFFLHLTPHHAERNGGSLRSQLGEIPQRLERYPLAELRIGRSIAYDVGANWKLVLENYNECYHCAGVHPELCDVVPAFKRGGMDLDWVRGIPHRPGAFTFTFSGTTSRKAFAGLNDDERTRHKGELAFPNFMLSLSADHVAAFRLMPLAPDRTCVTCDILYHPDEIAGADFDPSDAADFWDLVNRQDWAICERVQEGMQSRAFEYGYYGPMEDASLDIRRYIAARLGAI